jgi:hypothetical protein
LLYGSSVGHKNRSSTAFQYEEACDRRSDVPNIKPPLSGWTAVLFDVEADCAQEGCWQTPIKRSVIRTALSWAPHNLTHGIVLRALSRDASISSAKMIFDSKGFGVTNFLLAPDDREWRKLKNIEPRGFFIEA